jgi:hypothetical protein
VQQQQQQQQQRRQQAQKLLHCGVSTAEYICYLAIVLKKVGHDLVLALLVACRMATVASSQQYSQVLNRLDSLLLMLLMLLLRFCYIFAADDAALLLMLLMLGVAVAFSHRYERSAAMPHTSQLQHLTANPTACIHFDYFKSHLTTYTSCLSPALTAAVLQLV